MEEQTPLMKQFWELKKQAGDALLLFRMGDFYELFGDDAIEAARILEITLTSRDKGKANPIPMAGVPHHSIQGYIQRLLKAGKKVAMGDQMEDPSKMPAGRAIVRRAVTRIFTPGVQFDAEGSEPCYLAAIMGAAVAGSASEQWVLALLDASTGETVIGAPMTAITLAAELGGLPIRHLLHLKDALQADAIQSALGNLSSQTLVEELPLNYLSFALATETLKRHYEVEQLGAFVPTDAGVHALGIAVTYALRTQQQEKLAHLRIPSPLHRPRTMLLGPRVAQHLDLLPGPDNSPHLYQLINRTRSALGARQLKRWLLAPLKAPEEIRARQDAVRELTGDEARLVGKLSAQLGQVYDLERIMGRINTRLANPRDTLALGKSLSTLPALGELLATARAPLLQAARAQLAELSAALAPLALEITRNQRDDAPLTARDGGIFNTGTTPDLDHLLSLTENGQRWLVELETRERELTGIPSLKVRYNRVFGYYIEITQAHLKSAPSHYQRKQTTVGAERFFTEELKKFEDEILNASSRQKALEQELFDGLLKSVQVQTRAIMDAGRLLGEIDSLVSLASLAGEPGWIFPVVDDSLELDLKGGRHPLVDGLTRGQFVPNDVCLSPSSRMTLMITGPNMGGKSTVMRQTALIVILGQIGAPVPAIEARWGSVSSLYTRIGAHDAISRGQSTFMVEMSELAHILHYADDRSLIILDEIGRGTSTYDGISVAWATLEWICNQIRARTLFATHYHELTRLEGELPLLANAHMAVEGARSMNSGGLRFLYKLKQGPANESFGIHVARIAGLPRAVVERSWKVLEELEKHALHSGGTGTSAQMSLFEAALAAEPDSSAEVLVASPSVESSEPALPHPVLTELGAVNVNEMTPVQALNFVVKLQEISRERASASF